MAHYVIELAIWVLALYFVGCLTGASLRRMFNSPAVVAPVLPETGEAKAGDSAPKV